MIRPLTMMLLGLAVSASMICAAAAAPEPCKDCNPETGLTIREQIKADRAREVERIAKESTARPWDGKDIGQINRANQPPLAR